jgi:O-antigen/teichoic acid export membrane protein
VKGINLVFFKDTAIYVLSSGLSRVLLIILIPLYTKYLSVEEFGQYDFNLSVISICSVIFSFGLPQALQLEFFDVKENKVLINKIFSTHLFLSLFLLPLFVTLFYLFEIVSIHTRITTYEILLSLVIISQSIASFYQTSFLNILKMNQETVYYFKQNLIIVLVQAILSILILLYMENKVFYLLLGNFSGVILTVVLCSKKIKIQFSKSLYDFKLIVEKCKLGIILVLGYFAYWVVNGADRWIVLKILGNHELGIYAIAARLSSALEPLLLTPIIAAYLPRCFKNYEKKHYKEKLGILSFGIMAVFILFAVLANYFLPYVLSQKTPLQTYRLMPYFIMGYAFYFIAQISVNILVYRKEFMGLLRNITIVAIVNITLNVFFLKKIGLMGAGYAFLIANVCWMLLSLYERNRVIKKLRIENHANS